MLLPPANTLALVEFLEVGEAKKAFRQLAYSKLHGSPLFSTQTRTRTRTRIRIRTRTRTRARTRARARARALAYNPYPNREQHEPLFMTLASQHNLIFMNALMADIRARIMRDEL